jgi:protein Tex
MKLNDVAPSNTGNRSESGERANGSGAKGSAKHSGHRQQTSSAPVGNTAFAEAFAKLKAKN